MIKTWYFVLCFLTHTCAFIFKTISHVHQSTTRIYKYVPDGLSSEEWDRIKESEKQAKTKIKGLYGPRGYKSRSMNDFVKALEDGTAKHLMPVDPRKVLSGEIKMEDVPYMQRPGGAWDNSDLKTSTKITNLVERIIGYSFNNEKSKNTNLPKTYEQMWKDAGAITIEEAKNKKSIKLNQTNSIKNLFFWK